MERIFMIRATDYSQFFVMELVKGERAKDAYCERILKAYPNAVIDVMDENGVTIETWKARKDELK